jgi:hypothetical protein
VAVFGVVLKVRHQRGGNGLPADGFTFLAEPDQALIVVEVTGL